MTILGGPELIYSGKAKNVYKLDDRYLILEFKDELTAFDGAKRDNAPQKGALAAAMSAWFFKVLEEHGIPTHFVEYDGDRRLKVLRTDLIPLEVIVRNYAYGSQLKRMPLLKKLQKFSRPIVEFHYKSDELHDPLVLEDDIIEAGLLNENELRYIKDVALKVNEILSKIFENVGLTFIDMKLEFGRLGDKIVLIDEISGDTFRVIDREGKHLDKECYRRGASPTELVSNYKKILEVLNIKIEPIKIEGK